MNELKILQLELILIHAIAKVQKIMEIESSKAAELALSQSSNANFEKFLAGFAIK